jgi:SAM-dependent methyltransferase
VMWGQMSHYRIRMQACHRLVESINRQFGINLFSAISKLVAFIRDYFIYKRETDNAHFTFSMDYLYPCLTDKTKMTPIEPIYFYQDTWAARLIYSYKPKHHYDVGSSVKTVGIISQFIPTTMVDIRPIELKLENLSFQKGSIVDLPFMDCSIESLSSLCVVEHIGLGRYGDPIDPWGSEKAINELKRVLKPGGNLMFSVPVDEENRVYFNAHRAFTREYIIDLFHGLKLIEEKYIYGAELQSAYDKSKGFGTGLFHFTKER